MTAKHRAEALIASNPSLGKPISVHKLAYWIKVPAELLVDADTFDNMIASYRRKAAMRRRKAELMGRRWAR